MIRKAHNQTLDSIVLCFLIGICILQLSCGQASENNNGELTDSSIRIKIPELMDTMFVDGFDYPVGNKDGKGDYVSKTDGKTYKSWYIATDFAENYSLGIHPGIDLNGTGGGNTDIAQPVHSIAKGMVEVAKDFGKPWGHIISIKHKYLINGKAYVCYSVYAHLEGLKVKKGDFVTKRTLIGEIGTGGGSYPAHLHLEIRKSSMAKFDADFWPSSNSKEIKWVQEHYEDPKKFIDSNRKLTVPYLETNLLVAVKNQYTLYFYNKGKLRQKYEIALSQKPIGHKEHEGDLKMPEGEYYICEKQKGPFYGNYADFLGPRILRISYPNSFDAEAGFNKGLINSAEKVKIKAANKTRSILSKNTKLGGGIVIHGWKGDWTANGRQNITWGCISMHNSDLEDFYEKVNLNTKILILP
jgi:murein DD-endopeptidase MepM/ murein hydrolase activator NlpD